MICKHEFEKACAELRFDEDNIQVAARLWEQAERAMQGKPTSTPALLNPALFLDDIKLANETRELSQGDLQFLKRVLSEALFKASTYKTELKWYIQSLWEKCDPSDPNAAETFKSLNAHRNVYRRMKRDLKRLASVQHKIKKQISQ